MESRHQCIKRTEEPVPEEGLGSRFGLGINEVEPKEGLELGLGLSVGLGTEEPVPEEPHTNAPATEQDAS